MTDDAPALQKAIDAAIEQGRTLLLPAGNYRINSTLNVLSSARKNQPGYGKHPLRLVGEGLGLSTISAAVPLHAVLNYSCASGPTLGASDEAPGTSPPVTRTYTYLISFGSILGGMAAAVFFG